MSEPDEFDWPESDYRPPEFPLRRPFDLLEPVPFDPAIVARMQLAFGSDSIETLAAVLREAEEVISVAMENSELDAHAAWVRHEVWFPTLGASYRIPDEPARLLIESIDLVGTREYSEQQLCAALALWCYGEHFEAVATSRHETQMLEQAALALAESEFYRGIDFHKATSSKERSLRSKAAAEKSHEANRANKLRGFAIWESRIWRVQADAEREIAAQCKIVQAVAGRWIRDFKHAPDAYRAAQSKHYASQRP